MAPFFLWESWCGRLSPVVLHHDPILGGAYLLQQREVASTRRPLSDAEALLSLDALAKLYPAPTTAPEAEAGA
jgi:hypothetical protein